MAADRNRRRTGPNLGREMGRVVCTRVLPRGDCGRRTRMDLSGRADGSVVLAGALGLTAVLRYNESVTTRRYNEAVQRGGTTNRYNEAVQRGGTTRRHNEAVQRIGTTRR